MPTFPAFFGATPLGRQAAYLIMEHNHRENRRSQCRVHKSLTPHFRHCSSYAPILLNFGAFYPRLEWMK